MYGRHALLAIGLVTFASEASQAPCATCYAVTSENLFITFDTANPSAVQTGGVISGLGVGEEIVGLDIRPANARPYILTQTPGGVGRLYTVNPNTSLATLASTLNRSLSGLLHGIDFDPVSGRLRIVSDDTQNVQVNPDTGEVTVDAKLLYTVGDPNAGVFPTIFGAAYTNRPGDGSAAALYSIDNGTDALVRIDPANGGVLRTVGPLGVDAAGYVAFDISLSPVNHAFATISTGFNKTGLFFIDLETGRATLVGDIGPNISLLGFTVAPNYPQTAFSRRQTIRINANGTGYQELDYNYTTGQTTVSPYSATSGSVPRMFPFVEWTGVYHYDYGAGRFTQALYSGHDLL